MKSETTNTCALYVHFPFCAHLCHYCDFAKLQDHPDQRAAFLHTLKQEFDELHLGSLQTLYWGGGTPSVHPIEELQSVASWMKHLLTENYEWTVEINPETVTREKLAALLAMGVNRLSIGVQTLNNQLLSDLGRNHRSDDVYRVIELALSVGFTNISCDLMVGLPKQTINDLEDTLDVLLRYPLTHLSLYSLTIEPHTKFYLQGVSEGDEDLIRRMYDLAEERLLEAGFEHYEVSNFARGSSYRSKHNLVYWTYQPYAAIGPGAHGFTGTSRYENKRNFTSYFKGDIRREWTPLSRYDQEFEYMMLGLRVKEGISIVDYEQRFNRSLVNFYDEAIKELKAQGLVELSKTHLRSTKNGMMLLHRVILTLTAQLDKENTHASSRL